MKSREEGSSVGLEEAPDLVLWDFDGTLADTSGDVWASLRYAAACMRRCFAPGFEQCDENLSLPMSLIADALEPKDPPIDVDEFGRNVRVHYRSINTHCRTRLYPGINTLLDTLRALGIRNYIVTNKPREALERLLELKGWGYLFSGWMTSDMGVTGELSKEQMICRVLARAGVVPERAVMVGDSWGDVRGARLAGVPCVGVTYGDGETSRLLAENPDQIAPDVEKLAEILVGDVHD